MGEACPCVWLTKTWRWPNPECSATGCYPTSFEPFLQQSQSILARLDPSRGRGDAAVAAREKNIIAFRRRAPLEN
eukprot:6174667-Pleurochrysis_carterae.AAC.2